MRIILYPYKIGSQSCRDLQDTLQTKFEGKILRVRPDGAFVRRRHDIVINWGSSKSPKWNYEGIINSPAAVRISANKLRTLVCLRDHHVQTVPFTTTKSETQGWNRIVCRAVLEGHSGEGITIMRQGEALPDVPVYTKFIPRSREYRVHVFRGEIIDYAKKVKRIDGRIVSNAQSDDMIRSAALGWEFIRAVTRRPSVEELAKQAVSALGLDFGAVDILRDREGNCYVLEVGTAPGLSNLGLEAYANAIIGLTH